MHWESLWRLGSAGAGPALFVAYPGYRNVEYSYLVLRRPTTILFEEIIKFVRACIKELPSGTSGECVLGQQTRPAGMQSYFGAIRPALAKGSEREGLESTRVSQTRMPWPSVTPATSETDTQRWPASPRFASASPHLNHMTELQATAQFG